MPVGITHVPAASHSRSPVFVNYCMQHGLRMRERIGLCSITPLQNILHPEDTKKQKG